MAGTTVFNVAAKTQLPPFAINPLTCVSVGPAVLGGTVLVETAPTQNGPWSTAFSATNGGSVRPSVNQWCRVTATTQAATVALTDMGTSNIPSQDQLASVNGVFASPNTTSEVVLYSLRVPPNYLPPTNWRMMMILSFVSTNNANVKNVSVRANGLAGSLMATYVITSAATTNILCNISSAASDGVSINGYGPGVGAGLGLSTTAVVTLSRDYLNNETEFVITATKATGTDAVSLNSAYISLQ